MNVLHPGCTVNLHDMSRFRIRCLLQSLFVLPLPLRSPQHLSGLHLLAELSAGRLKGAKVASTQVWLTPGKLLAGGGGDKDKAKEADAANGDGDQEVVEMEHSGEGDAAQPPPAAAAVAPAAVARYEADTGTAGAVTLLLQAALPCLAFGAAGRVQLSLKGGTDVAWSPQIEYTQRVFLPMARRFGIDCELKCLTKGFYPKGGGHAVLNYDRAGGEAGHLSAVDLTTRGDIVEVVGTAWAAGGQYSLERAERMAAAAKASLLEHCATLEVPLADIAISVEPVYHRNVADCGGTDGGVPSAFGQGAGVLLVAKTDQGLLLGVDQLVDRKTSCEQAAAKAGEQLAKELQTGAALDSRMQDQLVVLAALARGRSKFLLGKADATLHTQSALDTCNRILGIQFNMEQHEGAKTLWIEGAAVRL